MEYNVIQVPTKQKIPMLHFIRKCNDALKEGWKPLGGPFMFEWNLCQAMIKEE